MTDLEDRILAAMRADLQEELPWFNDLSPEDQQALVEQTRDSYWGAVRAVKIAWEPAVQAMVESLESCCDLMAECIRHVVERLEAIGGDNDCA